MPATLQNSTPPTDFRVSDGDLALLLGTPFKEGGRNLNGFDCWGLVLWVYHAIFRIQLPRYALGQYHGIYERCKLFEAAASSPDWQRIEDPEQGCIVAMSKGGAIHHAGIWLDKEGGGCLHVYRGGTVVFHTLQTIKRHGYSRILFFKWSKFSE